MPAGRPTTYDPAYCDQVVELGKIGYSPAQMAAHFDVSRQTIDNWAASNPEFLEAFARALTHCQAWWESQGMDGMQKPGFNATVWTKSVQARFRHDYTERQEQTHRGDPNNPIGHRVELVIVDPEA